MPLFPSTIKHTPVTLAGNRVIVKIPAATPAALGAFVRASLIYKVKVYIEEVKGSGKFVYAGEKSGHEKYKRTKNGVDYLDGASFDISDILQAAIPDGVYNLDQYVATPYIHSQASEYLASIKYYYTTEIFTLATVPVSSGILTAIKGKLSKSKFSSWKNTFFTSRMDDLGNFLTWSPATKYISKTQKEYLFFLQNWQPAPSGATSLYLEFTFNYIYPVTGLPLSLTSSASNIYLTPGFGKVHTIPVGFEQANIPYLFLYSIALLGGSGITIDHLLSYSVQVVCTSPSVFFASEKRTFILKTNSTRYTARSISFKNSLDTFDTLVFEGKSTETATVKRATVEKAITDDGLPTIPELETVAVDGIHEISLNTGYLEGYDADYLLELLYSDDIRLQTDEGLIPLQLITDDLVYKDETEFLKQRAFRFRFSNTEIAGTYLGAAPVIADRPTQWIGIEPFCLVDDFGKYNGQMKFNSLELYYADGAQEVVLGAQPKLNIEGTEGYIAPASSPQCLAALTPITNAVQSRLGTYKKTTCVMPQIGDYPTITIPAGTYGGPDLATANQRALDAIKVLDTQDYANTGAGAAACITGPWAYAMGGIPANRFNLRWGQRPTANSEKLTGIAAGTAVNSGNPADVIYGNTWYCFGNTNPSSLIYSPLLFDILLPIAPGMDYKLDVYTAVAKTVTVYKNGVSVFTNSVTLGDIAGTGYKRITLTGLTFTTGDRYYINIV